MASPEHAQLIAGLIAKTDADELIWHRRPGPFDPHGVDRHAELDDLRLTLGLAELNIWGEHAGTRIPACQELAGLSDAVVRQRERLSAQVLADATAAVGLPSSGEHGPGGATGSAESPGPTPESDR